MINQSEIQFFQFLAAPLFLKQNKTKIPIYHFQTTKADSKPPKPAIKSSTLPRTSSQGKLNRINFLLFN